MVKVGVESVALLSSALIIGTHAYTKRRHHRVRPGRTYGSSVHGAREFETAGHRGARSGRAVDADDARRELAGVSRRHHGTRPDDGDAGSGGALRRGDYPRARRVGRSLA